MRKGYDNEDEFDRREDLPLLPSFGAQRPPGLQYMMGGCGIAGTIDVNGGKIPGSTITSMLTTMRERENGLGA